MRERVTVGYYYCVLDDVAITLLLRLSRFIRRGSSIMPVVRGNQRLIAEGPPRYPRLSNQIVTYAWVVIYVPMIFYI